MDNKIPKQVLKSYVDQYKPFFQKELENYFDKLVKEQSIDIDENIKLVNQINYHDSIIKSVDKEYKDLKFSRKNVFLGSLIYFTVGAFFIFDLTTGQRIIKNFNPYIYWLVAILLIIISILFIPLMSKFTKQKIKPKKENLEKHLIEYNRLCAIGKNATNPLVQYLNSYDYEKLLTQTLPFVKLYDRFEQYDDYYLNENFSTSLGIDENESVYYLKSGYINSYLFVILGKKIYHDSTLTYSATKDIWWETKSEEEHILNDGKTITTTTHTQKLNAHIESFYPSFTIEEPKILYWNFVEYDLSFDRRPSKINALKGISREKYIEKETKFFEKQMKKFSHRADNVGFDAFFRPEHVTDRIKLYNLFGKSEQDEMVKLLQDRVHGYGDHFKFAKKNHEFTLTSDIKNIYKFSNIFDHIHDYSLEKMKEKFLELNLEYFRRVYFSIAPILCISKLNEFPLYNGYKPKKEFTQHLSNYEHEFIFNNAGIKYFEPGEIHTQYLLKAKVTFAEQNLDRVKVDVTGYKKTPTSRYVKVKGGDDRTYDLKVKYDEYEKISKTKYFCVLRIPNMTKKIYAQVILRNPTIAKIFDEVLKNPIYFKDCIIFEDNPKYTNEANKIFTDLLYIEMDIYLGDQQKN